MLPYQFIEAHAIALGSGCSIFNGDSHVSVFVFLYHFSEGHKVKVYCSYEQMCGYDS